MAQEVASCSRRAALRTAVLSAAALLPAGPVLAVQGLTAGRIPGKPAPPAEARLAGSESRDKRCDRGLTDIATRLVLGLRAHLLKSVGPAGTSATKNEDGYLTYMRPEGKSGERLCLNERPGWVMRNRSPAVRVGVAVTMRSSPPSAGPAHKDCFSL